MLKRTVVNEPPEKGRGERKEEKKKRGKEVETKGNEMVGKIVQVDGRGEQLALPRKRIISTYRSCERRKHLKEKKKRN